MLSITRSMSAVQLLWGHWCILHFHLSFKIDTFLNEMYINISQSNLCNLLMNRLNFFEGMTVL